MGNLRNFFYSSFFSGIAGGALSIILPLYFSLKFESSLALMGLVFSIYSLLFIVLQIPSSYFGDKFNRRGILIFSDLLMLSTIVVYGAASRIWHFAVGNALKGLSGSLNRAASNTVLVDISQRERFSESFGNLIGSFFLGYVIGYLIAGPVVGMIGYQRALYGLAVFQAAALYFICQMRYEQKKRSIKFNIRKFFHKPHRTLKILALTGFLVSLVEVMDATVTVIFIKDVFSASITQIGLVLGVGYFSFGITQMIFGKRSDRGGRKKYYVYGMGLALVSAFMIPNMPSLVGVGLFFALLCMGHGIAFPAVIGIIAEHTSEEYRSQDFGFVSTFEELGKFVGLPLMGWIADTIGYDTSFYFRGAVLLTAAIIVALFVREKGRNN